MSSSCLVGQRMSSSLAFERGEFFVGLATTHTQLLLLLVFNNHPSRSWKQRKPPEHVTIEQRLMIGARLLSVAQLRKVAEQ